jgi:hypothetical protein
VSPCRTRLSGTVCEFFRVFVVSRFRPKVASATRGRGRLEVTSPFDASTPLMHKWSVYSFCLSLSVHKLFNIFVLARNSHRGRNFGVLGVLNPLIHAHINKPRKGTSLRQTASFEPSFVRRSVRPLRDCEKN